MRVNTCWFTNRRTFKSTVESFIYCKVHGNRDSDYQGVPALTNSAITKNYLHFFKDFRAW